MILPKRFDISPPCSEMLRRSAVDAFRFFFKLEDHWPCAGGCSAGNERHRYAIARPDELGTGTMAVEVYMDAVA